MASPGPILPALGDGTLLDRALRAVRPPDADAMAAARARQQELTKPRGSLGVLEDLSVRLAGLAGLTPAPIPDPAVVGVFAADHGVAAHGVSIWPQEVTAQMVANYLAGGAAVNVLARHARADVLVVDLGVATPIPATPIPATSGPAGCGATLLDRRIRPGTGDITTEPAMTRREAVIAVETGIQVAHQLVDDGYRCLLTAEMGIGNTTTSAALIAAFTGTDPDVVTGRGAGLPGTARGRKVDAVRAALDLHRPDPTDPIGVLAAVGGLEQAALAGFVLGAAARRVPVLLDGVIAGAAALAAAALAPDVTHACIAGHRSVEPGHHVTLQALGLSPLVDLGLRLGEGTGALLALPLVQAAAHVLREMATFDSAGVAASR